MAHKFSVRTFYSVLVVAFVLLPSYVSSQIVEKIFENPVLYERMYPLHDHSGAILDFPGKEVDSTLDVQSYELWFDLRRLVTVPHSERGQMHFSGIVNIVFTVTKPVDRITLDAEKISVLVASVNNQLTEVEKSAGGVTVNLGHTLQTGQTDTLTLVFIGEQSRRGMYGYSSGEIDTSAAYPFGIAYIFTEPTDSRYAYPCHDAPHDKAMFTAHIRVPEGYTGVSNGLLKDVKNEDDGSVWFTWQENNIMPTYLFSVAASVFDTLNQQATSIDGRIIPIYNFFWPMDRDSSPYSAVNALKSMPKMIPGLEKYFGRYPFASYGHVFAAPLTIGAMEHQTMTLANRKWLNGQAEAGLAHELAHQWTGDIVSCGTWSDIWLNEGGASWGEALWSGEVYGRTGYNNQMMARKIRYLKTSKTDPPIYDPPPYLIFNEGTTYCKSGWVYHMLYRMYGDVFISALQEWLSRPIPTSKQTYEFVNFLKQQIPDPIIPWDTFFDQWLIQKFHPQILATAELRSQHGTTQATVWLTQVQDTLNIPTVFQFPLRLRFMGVTEVVDTTIIVRNREEKVDVTVGFPVDSVALDPDNDVLLESTVEIVTKIRDDQHREANVRITGSTPHQAGVPLVLLADANVSASVYSIDGRRISVLKGSTGRLVFDTRGWRPGVYAMYVEGGLPTVLKFIVVD